jgi:hypothetical protein
VAHLDGLVEEGKRAFVILDREELAGEEGERDREHGGDPRVAGDLYCLVECRDRGLGRCRRERARERHRGVRKLVGVSGRACEVDPCFGVMARLFEVALELREHEPRLQH